MPNAAHHTTRAGERRDGGGECPLEHRCGAGERERHEAPVASTPTARSACAATPPGCQSHMASQAVDAPSQRDSRSVDGLDRSSRRRQWAEQEDGWRDQQVKQGQHGQTAPPAGVGQPAWPLM